MISIVAPAYNEEDVIESYITQIQKEVKLKEPFELVIVDDGSKDNTSKILKKLQKNYKNLRVITHKVNKNLGGALKTGIKNAKGRIIITMDADMTHSPYLIPNMIQEIDRGYDLCIASRYIKEGGMKNVPTWRVLLSYFANLIFSIAYFTRARDLTAGYKAYRSDKVKKINIKRKGFDAQLELTVKMLRYKVKEIPYILESRKEGASKFNFIKNIPIYTYTFLRLIPSRWI